MTRKRKSVAKGRPAAEEPCCASLGGPQEPWPPSGAIAAEAEATAAEGACCEEQPASGEAKGTAQQAFQQFMATAFAPGALDPVQKTVTAIALSVAVQCEPCLRIHVQKGQRMGLTVEDITEAAWMGVAFGGCKAMMFWRAQSAALGTNRGAEVSK